MIFLPHYFLYWDHFLSFLCSFHQISSCFFCFVLFCFVDCCSSLVNESKILGVFNCLGKCYIPAGTFFHFYLLSITHFLIHSSFFDHVNFRLSVPIILVVANDSLAIGLPNSCLLWEVSLIVSCFVCFSFDFHFTPKNCSCRFQTDCYVFLCEFSNANG